MLRFFSPRFSSLLNSQKYAFSELKKFQHSFLNTTNLDYIESLYEQWLVDKSSVSPSFAAYFELLEQGKDPHEAVDHPSAVAGSLAGLSANKEITKQLKMRLMIETYRSIGHQFAKIDPLDLPQNKNLFGRLPDDVLKASAFGFEENEMNESIVVKNLRGTGEDNGPYTVK
jgi:2-oxoglutarate dehydrogenase complex dehydrogenase (E1) component-like enzyme